MTSSQNHLSQPVGFLVPGWTPRPRPPRTPLIGRYCRVEPLEIGRHAAELHAANLLELTGRAWTYLPVGPFAELADYRAWLEAMDRDASSLFHAIVDLHTDRAVGLAAYLRITPEHGVIEVGHINYSPLLQRTPAGTEAMYLMMRRAFDELGYRRYEWKCDTLNTPSRAAAQRYGFRFEGIFRQAVVVKGRNRDTAWFAITDREWPPIKSAFEAWLEPTNFDEQGRQRTRLSDLMPPRQDFTDPITALRGSGRGEGNLAKLLADRAADVARE